MARILTYGFDQDSPADELSTLSGAITGNVDAVTSPAHINGYSLRIYPSDSIANLQRTFTSASIPYGYLYIRFYFNYTTLPAAESLLLNLSADSNYRIGCIRNTSSSTIAIYDSANNRIGVAGSIPIPNRWYRIEYMTHSALTGATSSLYIDGQLITSGVGTIAHKYFQRVQFGSAASMTGDFYFDDFAVNDTSGSYQNTFPGAGHVVYLFPNGVGDSTQWTPTPAGNNWERVSEVPPDDANYVADMTLNNTDFYTVADEGIPENAKINAVCMQVHCSNDGNDATAAFNLHIKKQSGGTNLDIGAIVPAGTTPKTMQRPAIYLDPDNNVWTSETVKTMQIGYRTSVVGAYQNRVRDAWAQVDYSSKIKSINTVNIAQVSSINSVSIDSVAEYSKV